MTSYAVRARSPLDEIFGKCQGKELSVTAQKRSTARSYIWAKENRSVGGNRAYQCSALARIRFADQPVGRFEFTFTPTHGSWLNLIEGFFSKVTRSVLRHIRVASKEELKARIMAAMDEFNRHPIVHTWSYKLDRAA
jgi:hypothetical protein